MFSLEPVVINIPPGVVSNVVILLLNPPLTSVKEPLISFAICADDDNKVLVVITVLAVILLLNPPLA